jgi:hypothetical protein
VLRGNLAPDGAVIKPAAAEARLLKHAGPAVVFADYNDMAARIDDPALPVTADSVLVLKHAGPLGAPGMPEWGQLPIPKKLLEAGVRDMVRISDARMSGTSYGACVLHVAPESYVGGPLALVRDGDMIALDVAARTLVLDVPEAEIARRRAAWRRPEPRYTRGFGALYQQHVTQADQGCDFDFRSTAPTAEPKFTDRHASVIQSPSPRAAVVRTYRHQLRGNSSPRSCKAAAVAGPNRKPSPSGSSTRISSATSPTACCAWASTSNGCATARSSPTRRPPWHSTATPSRSSTAIAASAR